MCITAQTLASVIDEYGYEHSACSACAKVLSEALSHYGPKGYTAEDILDALRSVIARIRGGDYILDLDQLAQDIRRGYCPIGETR